MDDSDDSMILHLPSLIYDPGSEPDESKIVQHHSNFNYVKLVEKELGEVLFAKLEQSFLYPLIQIGRRPAVNFSGKLFHFLMQRRIETAGEDLWFRFGCQPMRFSAREFFLTTGIPFEKKQTEAQRKGKNVVGDPYVWTKGEKVTVPALFDRLKKLKLSSRDDNEKEKEMLCLGAVILTEAILIASPVKERICVSRLVAASDFEEYSSQPWGAISYEILASSIKRMSASTWTKTNYDVKGFVWAITLWALSAVPVLGRRFAITSSNYTEEMPLCLKWLSTQSPLLDKIKEFETEQVQVITIIGNPNSYLHLVPETKQADREFFEILEQVKNGYKLKKEDWIRKWVDILAACDEVGDRHIRDRERSDLSQGQKLDRILDLLEDFDRRITIIEAYLESRKKEASQAPRGNDAANNNGEETLNEQPLQEDLPNVDNANNNTQDGINSTLESSLRPDNTQDGSYGGDDEHTVFEKGYVSQSDDTLSDEQIGKEQGKAVPQTPGFGTPTFKIISDDSEKQPGTIGEKGGVAGPSNEKILEQPGRRSRRRRRVRSNKELPPKKKVKEDENDDVPYVNTRRSKRTQGPSVHLQHPFTAEKKKHPILYPFAKVDGKRMDALKKWEETKKRKSFKFGEINVDLKWFNTLSTPGKAIQETHVEAFLLMLNKRKEENEEINKKALVIGHSFLRAMDEVFFNFMEYKNTFKFPVETLGSVVFDKSINTLYIPLRFKKTCWNALQIRLDLRTISLLEVMSTKVTENHQKKTKSLIPYSQIIPYIVKEFIKEEEPDLSPFTIKIKSDLPKVDRTEDTGIYILKIIECYSMNIYDLVKLSEEKVEDLRTKIAADIFAELFDT